MLQLSCSDLGVVLQNALPLIRPFEVLAANAFAIGVAGNSRLKTFTVLFQAFAFFAIAAFCVALLAIIA